MLLPGINVWLGIVLNQSPSDPASADPADIARARLEDGRLVRWYMDPLLLGRLLRGLHRYSADACVLLTVLHTLREQEYEQFSQELKLNGNLFVDNLRYTVGVLRADGNFCIGGKTFDGIDAEAGFFEKAAQMVVEPLFIG